MQVTPTPAISTKNIYMVALALHGPVEESQLLTGKEAEGVNQPT